MANVLPSSSSLNNAPPPSLEKFACIFVQDNHAWRLEWYAFDLSDNPKLNQTLPPLSLSFRYVNHHLTPHPLHEDDESKSKVYLKPITTASKDRNWGVMWAILDNHLHRFLGNNPPLTQQFRSNLVERICIKDLSNTSPDSASKWEPVDSMPTFVVAAHTLVLGGKLYYLGGVNESGGPWSVAWGGEILCAYNLLTKAWSMARFPIHDDEEYFNIFEPHFLLYLAHLGSDKLFWFSLLPVEPRNDEDFFLSGPNTEDKIIRLHCLKFQVTTIVAYWQPSPK